MGALQLWDGWTLIHKKGPHIFYHYSIWMNIFHLCSKYFDNFLYFTAVFALDCFKVGPAAFFYSLFWKSKGEHLWNKEKYFLFHSENSFHFFSYLNVMTSSHVQTWNMKRILLNNLGSKHRLVTKFGQSL